MKRILLLLAALTLSAAASGPLMAQESPFVGTWKLNTDKSTFTGVPMPKSLDRKVEADGDGAKYTYKGTNGEGKPIDYTFSTKLDGKPSPINGTGAPGGADSITINRVNASKTTGVFSKGGKEIGKSTAEVSKDGKVTTVTGTGTTAAGKEYNTTSVYDKQ
jgi:hypothetical protein